jgi:ATP-binding cassette subfamily B protein
MEEIKKKTQKYTKVSLVLEFLRGNKHFFILSILTSMVVAGLEMISPQLIRVTVDSIIGDRPIALPDLSNSWIKAIGGIPFLRAHLWFVGIAIVVVAGFTAIFRYLSSLYNAKGAQELIRTMRNRLFSHIQKLPFSWHMQNQTGDIIQRCTSDVELIKNFISEQLTRVFRVVILIGLAFVLCFL